MSQGKQLIAGGTDENSTLKDIAKNGILLLNTSLSNLHMDSSTTSQIGTLNFAIKASSSETEAMKPKAVAFYQKQTANTSLYGVRKVDVGLDFTTLRRIARYDTVIRIAIQAIKKEVSQSSWSFVKKPNVQTMDPAEIKAGYELFDYINFEGENLRSMLDRVIDDILVLDAGTIEKIRNFKKEIVALNSVDAATIQPNFNPYGEYGTPAYYQVIDTKMVAEFEKQDLIYIMANPQNDVKRYGYGMSPIESIILTVQAALNADLYNATIFAMDNVPPGILNLGNVNENEAEAIKAMWDAQTIGNTQQLRFMYGPDKVDFVNFKGNNKDMQYQEYVDWLTRLKLAAFGLSGIDANIFQDVNRATAEVQAQVSQSRGVQNMKHLIEEAFNVGLFQEMGFTTVDFKFDRLVSMADKKSQADIYKIYVGDTGIMTINEARQELGLQAIATPIFAEDTLTPEESQAQADQNMQQETPNQNSSSSEFAGGNPKDEVLSEVTAKEVHSHAVYQPLY